MTPPTTVPMSSLLLLPVCSTATPRLKNPTAAAAANGVRWPGGGIRRRRQLGRCWAAVVEEAGAQEDGVLLPKEGDEAAERYDWRDEWYPLYLSKEVPDDAALPLTVFDRQLVLYRDADGVLRCHEDRCPHRLAKLSEGQLVDGKLECLYHGWQFDGQGKCVKIPQLPEGAKIPRNACARNYEVRDSQGVVWVWVSDANPPDERRLPWFEPYARPGFTDTSTVHELPYDHSILLENLMDPAHVPISHDRTDWTAKREDAQPLFFEVTERTARGFAGYWGRTRTPHLRNLLRFEAPCVLTNTLEFVDKDGKEQCFSAHFLCRPAGQGRSMLLVRFGSTSTSPLAKVFPAWYFHQNACKVFAEERGLLYLGMGVSGGEEGARNGPSLMPGGSFEAYKYIEDILLKVAAQVPDSGPCVTYIGKGGSGNFVKMVHNGIEYGDMQLIAEAYDVLKSVGKLTNSELQQVFSEWNKGELLSFLIEITADIFGVKDDQGEGYLVDKVLDKTGMKGTGKWTVQQAAELSVAAPTIAASLDSRFLSGLKDERVEAAKVFQGGFSSNLPVDKAQLVEDVRQALYASKICSYAQGMNILKAKSMEKGWSLNLGELARIWKGGCIIRAIFLDRINKAYDRNPDLANLLVDPEFAQEIMDRQVAWRRVVCLAINNGVSTPGMSTSLAYFDSYRRDRLPANLVQAQRDYFGAHTYERVDMPSSFHTEWFKIARNSKI